MYGKMNESLSIFAYNSYHTYLCDRLGSLGSRNGKRRDFAQKLGIHASYISLVLKGTSHLSLEQAVDANVFFGHSNEEGEFFVLLVSRDRAGTNLLRKHFQEQIDKMISLRAQVENHVDGKEIILKEIKEEYYSSYIYSAIFVLASIPEFQSPTTIANALNVPVTKVEKITLFLIRAGILERNNGTIRPGKRMLHLNNSKISIKKHHTNWRLHALQAIDRNPTLGSHYSACFSLSKLDAVKLNSLILENLEKYLKVIGKSQEEVAYVYNFDFYPLIDHL